MGLLDEIERLERNLIQVLERVRFLEWQIAEYNKSPEAKLAEYGYVYDRGMNPYQNITNVDQLLKHHTKMVLVQARGNKCLAARLLGINVKSLYNWLHRYGIDYEAGVVEPVEENSLRDVPDSRPVSPAGVLKAPAGELLLS